MASRSENVYFYSSAKNKQIVFGAGYIKVFVFIAYLFGFYFYFRVYLKINYDIWKIASDENGLNLIRIDLIGKDLFLA